MTSIRERAPGERTAKVLLDAVSVRGIHRKILDKKHWFLHNYSGESTDKHKKVLDGCLIDVAAINHLWDGGMCPSKSK